MGKRGPHQEPTALKVARGTYRRDRHGDAEAEPAPIVAQLDDAPKDLGEHGRRVWLEMGPKLRGLGLLTEVDLGSFHTYCLAHDEIARCEECLRKQGNYITTKASVIRHPASKDLAEWYERKYRYEREYGLTPSSRSGMKVDKPKKSGVASRRRA